MVGSAATDREAQDHERRVDRQLLDLLGVALTRRDHREVALVELLAERLHRGLDRIRIVGRPLRERRVAGLVHPDELRHAEPPRSGCPTDGTPQRPSFDRTRRVTSPPSARPFVSRMTWPMITPIGFMSPERRRSAMSGFAASAESTAASSSPPSPIAPRPSAATIAAGSPPSATSLSSTWRAPAFVTFFSATSPTSCASAAGETFDACGSSSPRRAVSSLVTQLASGTGSAPFAASASS